MRNHSEKLIEQKIYQLYNIEGRPKFWLNTIERFLWIKTYIVQLQIEGDNCIRTLRFRTQPSTEDVANVYIDRYLKKKFI